MTRLYECASKMRSGKAKAFLSNLQLPISYYVLKQNEHKPARAQLSVGALLVSTSTAIRSESHGVTKLLRIA